MCIRDSSNTIYRGGGGKKQLIVKNGEVLGGSIAIQVDILNLYGCLLYTSDAADERSSVDLGGRRIIKKKKKREKSGEVTMQKKNHTTHTQC